MFVYAYLSTLINYIPFENSFIKYERLIPFDLSGEIKIVSLLSLFLFFFLQNLVRETFTKSSTRLNTTRRTKYGFEQP